MFGKITYSWMFLNYDVHSSLISNKFSLYSWYSTCIWMLHRLNTSNICSVNKWSLDPHLLPARVVEFLSNITHLNSRLMPQCHSIYKDMLLQLQLFNTLRPRQDGRRFPDDIFKHIFWNENVIIFIKISLKFVPNGPIDNIPALVQIMAWRRPGDKPLSEPMVVSLLTHICVTRPQWVKGCVCTFVCIPSLYSDWCKMCSWHFAAYVLWPGIYIHISSNAGHCITENHLLSINDNDNFFNLQWLPMPE